MKNSYVSTNKLDTKDGVVALSTQVFEQIAKIILEDDKDVKLSSSYFKKPIECHLEENKIIIDIDLMIKHSNNVNETCSKKMKDIINVISTMTEFKSIKVNMSVKGFFI